MTKPTCVKTEDNPNGCWEEAKNIPGFYCRPRSIEIWHDNYKFCHYCGAKAEAV